MKLLLVLALVTVVTGSRPAVPHLDHVVVVVLENRERPDVLGTAVAPHLTGLAAAYADLANYHAVTHPSLPNYLALVSGSTHGIADDCSGCKVAGGSIGSLLTRKHLTWAAYAEGYPSSPRYVKRHVPFLYFTGEASHVKPLSAFKPTALPVFSFVVPDLCHGMHDCAVWVGDEWLAQFIRPLLRVPRTAIFVVFDEGTSNEQGGGHVAALVAGKAIRSHVRSEQTANHYVVLRTIEDALGLPRLGASAHAEPLAGIWR